MKNCLWCNNEFKPYHGRENHKFCSTNCADTYRNRGRSPNHSGVRNCKTCGEELQIVDRSDAHRYYCSKECTKTGQSKSARTWNEEHPGRMKKYNENRLKKNPNAWKEKWNKERDESIRLLGSKCVVCGATNKWWLHIDYIPTTRGMKYRHSRTLKFIKTHLSDFRLLCANHHYELTLTGRIEGTEITQ